MSSRGGRSYGGDSQRTTLIYQSRTPKPLYPINFLLASPLENLGQEGLRVIRIKRELDAYMRMSPFYLRSGTITAERKRPMMERYSDKYHTESSSIRAGSKSAISGGRGEVHKILADLSAIPGELHSVYDAGRAAKYAQQAAIKSAQTESNSVAQRRKAFLQRLLEAEDNDDNGKFFILFFTFRKIRLLRISIDILSSLP